MCIHTDYFIVVNQNTLNASCIEAYIVSKKSLQPRFKAFVLKLGTDLFITDNDPLA